MNHDSWLQRMKSSKGYGLLSTFIKSAAVGLLFAALCFVYDVYHDSEQDKQLEESIAKLENIEKSVEQLESIKQSLSTRYLGIFPDYITEIGRLFDSLNPRDTIVIFEDVLYYGIKSRPKEFFDLNVKLFNHAIKSGSITVAYYNYEVNKKSNKPIWEDLFHKMIIESRINPKYHVELSESRDKEIQKLREANRFYRGVSSKLVDSTLCEKFFAATRNDDIDKFKKDVDAYLSNDLIDREVSSLTEAERIAYQMCIEIDSVKRRYLGNGKPVENILFVDYESMYRGLSRVIVKFYAENGFELLPLDEYLTMSCWLVREGNQRGMRAVLAFPSKYSTDEIGFYSQDEAFSKYIGTMLKGVKQSRWLKLQD